MMKMTKKMLLVASATLALTACASKETGGAEAEEKFDIDNNNITAYGELTKGRITSVDVTEFTDTEGCKYIMVRTTDGLDLEEKSNSPCRKETK